MFIFCFRVFLFFLSFSLLFSLHTAAASARALDRVIITDEKDDDDLGDLDVDEYLRL